MTTSETEQTGVVATVKLDGAYRVGVGWTEPQAQAALYKSIEQTHDDAEIDTGLDGRMRFLHDIPLTGLFYAENCYNGERLTQADLKRTTAGPEYWDDDWDDQIQETLNSRA